MKKIVLFLAQHSGKTICENSFIKKTIWNFIAFSASVPRVFLARNGHELETGGLAMRSQYEASPTSEEHCYDW
jgi:hypothetical protein